MKKYVLILLLALIFVSCLKDCEDILEVFTVKVERSNGSAVALDHHFTLSENGDTLVKEFLQDGAQTPSTGFVLLLSNALITEENIRFVGMYNNVILVEETYMTMHDECRVTAVSGQKPIIIP
jgi:hypothetical protein